APAEERRGEIRLKIEINTREIEAFDPPQAIGYAVENPWFTGAADIAGFSREELLATKLRALLQRDKGRDLLDLAHALAVFPDLDVKRIAATLGHYLRRAEISISRAEAEKRMFAKLVSPRFVTDIRPLLSSDAAEKLTEAAVRNAFADVFSKLITAMPCTPWAKTPEKLEHCGLTSIISGG
ncbi:MAG: nucleotidyl transferase AbiEii/AbiGii toxin family protein, partial [Alphaproteobacteria bacterium]|nr:nucleotidyl transferase AbiEii/AbiGii toxin family protein [Alphaproteobacteria bacterium]